MEARASGVDDDAGGRTHEHPRDDTWRIAVLAEDVPEARAVASPEGREVHVLRGMSDDEGGVVVDARAQVERADQVVDLLARRSRQAERLVERTDALDHRAAQEDRERDRAVPQVLARQRR